ncbi:MAG TPA: inositol monophosphatase family protein [Gammaproteobacteria bacterium]|nr:inositol monophosphatase family protein [Gammaproteobacteria bacterium]
MDPLANIAVSAARRGGAVILRSLDRLDLLKVETKRHNDFVTEIDRRSEATIIETIRRAHPDHAILAEERGREDTGSAIEWIIDPLDGTTNYLHGFPAFSVSIAVSERGRLVTGVVYDPLREEMFVASRGQGALLNERRIRVAARPALEGALVGTGFPFRELRDLDDYLAMFRAVIERTSGLRRAGSAALDLAWTAAGRLDGFFELGLEVWDIAAGCLLIEEAGGIIGDVCGNAGWPIAEGNILAGNPRIFAALARALAPHLPPRLASQPAAERSDSPRAKTARADPLRKSKRK